MTADDEPPGKAMAAGNEPSPGKSG